MSLRAAATALLVAIPLLVGDELHAQQPASLARLVAFTNEPREPEFGKVFELKLSIRLAPDVVAFIPDTLLPAADAFSAGRGRWSSAAGPADSIDVEATYPVMGLMNGGVELPTIELLIRRPRSSESAGPKSTDELEAAGADGRIGLAPLELEIGGALILVPSEMAGREAAIDPRPPADVLGGDWSIWLIAALVTAAAALAFFARLFIVGWQAARTAAEARAQRKMPRAEALRELDRLLGLGWHTQGRFDEFYDATTGVLRGLSEQKEPEWRRALTSMELVGRIEGRWGESSVQKLRPTIKSAEWVKFGGVEPGPRTAEGDWTVVRDWIRGLPED